jgi:hypothetical protein
MLRLMAFAATHPTHPHAKIVEPQTTAAAHPRGRKHFQDHPALTSP